MTVVVSLSLGLASQGADFHTDFTEASLGDITGLNKDSPGAPTQDFDLNDVNDTLDFVTTNADMWGARANAPMAWVDAPTVPIGQTWSVETYLSMEKDGSNTREVAGIAFYGGPDGAKPDFGFGLDDWNGWNPRLQGLGDNNPNVGGADLGTAPGVFLRVEITEGGATDTYNFFYKANVGDAWSQLGGVATDFASAFDNSRVGLFLKSNNAGGGAQFDYLSVTEPDLTDSDSDTLPDVWELAQTGVTALTDLDGTITDPMGASGAASGDFDGDSVTDIDEYNGGLDSSDPGLTDSDGDGLDDAVETRNGTYTDANDTGTNPADADTDGDGLSDGFEVTNNAAGYDPNFDDSFADFDNDFLTVAQELAIGTDVLDDDTDDDTLLDGDETNTGIYVSNIDTGTNPLLKDSDGDGFDDNVESASGIYNGAADPGTDPNQADSDGDGLRDDYENNSGVNNGPTDSGTNPNVSDSDTDGWPDGLEITFGTDPNSSGDAPTAMGIPTLSLIQDLDAEADVTSDEVGVTDWLNQAASGGDDVSVFDGGAGDAQLLADATPTGFAAVNFNGGDKLIGDDDAAFDGIIQGSGLTWLAVVKVGDNQSAVNKSRIFGTLINAAPYSGYIVNMDNNELLGSVFRPGPTSAAQFQVDSTAGLNDGSWHVVGGRVAAGTGEQTQEVFVDSSTAEASGLVNVLVAANSGAISVGTERTGGGEYGIFTLARLLIYDRPLADPELTEAVSFLNTTYIGSGPAVAPILSIDGLAGTTLSMTVTGATNTEYVCKSGTDLMSFPDTETTDPATVLTDGSGTASFSIQVNPGTSPALYLRVEAVAP